MGCSVAGVVWAVCGPTLLGTAYPGRWPGQEACVHNPGQVRVSASVQDELSGLARSPRAPQ